MKSLPLLVGLLLFITGCATGPRGLPPSAGINNFDRVNDGLYRGAQPDSPGMEGLKRRGIKAIINLRMTGDVSVAEEVEARDFGMTYTNVPMRGLGRPTDEQVTKALLIIETFPAPVFIHCKYGCDRTGTIIACYRIQHDGWTSKAALSEARQHGMSFWEFEMRNYVREFAKSRKPKAK